mgnify:CR=1 FL=1
MCGIVGVLGEHEASPLLVEALKRLEYRGYDSAGIATVQAGRLDRRRAVGKLVNLSDLLVHEPLPGKAGIGHTRWATHGAPTVVNAHPHQAGPVAVVHNGIIENFKALREELAAANLGAETDTDTETIALLARHHLGRGVTPVGAAQATRAPSGSAPPRAFHLRAVHHSIARTGVVRGHGVKISPAAVARAVFPGGSNHGPMSSGQNKGEADGIR